MADESLFTGFHGTSTPSLRLEDLDPRRGVEAEGTVFFTSNEDMAHSFTLPREYGETVFERPTGEFGEFGEELYADIEPGPVLKASLRMRNPFILKGKEAQQAIDDTTYQGKILQQAKSGGFDGVVFEDVTEFADPGIRGDVYAVFNKGQIQSVQEPPPKDQPRAPLLLEGPSEEKTGKEPSKGRMFRGIGSLMRGRNILSLLQGLREGYELLPEEYQVLDEAWQYLKGTEFNPFDIDKPGIESFKELLGISPEDLGETILLPGPPQETEELPFSEVFLSRSTPEDMDINRGRRPPGRIVYAINNERGDNIGFVDIDSIDNGVANISDIVVSGRNSLGYRNMRQLLDQLQQKHPEIKRISGERVSGARRGGAHGFAGTGDDVSVDLSSPRGTSEILPKAAGGFIDKPLYDDQRMIG